MKKIIIITVFIFCVAQLANGHGLGQSLEKEVNGYVVDVGYDAVDKIQAGDATRFDFNLLNKDKSEIADFDHVWVRIAPQDAGIVFAGFLYRPEFLLTGMSYTFQEASKYELTVRFLDKEDKTLAEASFPLEIVSDETFSASFKSVQTVVGAVIGFFAGVGLAFIFLRKKNL